VEAPPFTERESHSPEKPSTRERRGGRSFTRKIALLEESNHKWRRTSRPCQGTPEEKEDTVGSVTMINSAMPSILTE
jgi:hypothetical protein